MRTRAVRPSVPLVDRLAWSVSEWSALNGFSDATGWRLVKAGAVAVVSTGGRTLITRDASEAWHRAATIPARAA
jgi:hypothetical protein